MAQFIPPGWKASSRANKDFTTRYTDIYKLVAGRAKKYFNLGSHKPQDLIQEGMIAALYAIDSYTPDRGSLNGYTGTVVENALAMIACEARTLSRQPYVWSEGADKPWERTALVEFHEPDEVECVRHNPEHTAMARERDLQWLRSRVQVQARLNGVRSRLAPDAREVFDLRISPPIELLVLARNMLGRSISAQARIPDEAYRQYLGMKHEAFKVAARAVRKQLAVHNLKLPA